LDITNAFNSIPWNKIIEALRYHPVPQYLVEVIQACLNDRWVEFNSKTGITRRPVERGVPQGSVLGPILWITAYGRVLRCPTPLGTYIVRYTGDTLILTGGRWSYETAKLAEDTVACVIREIRNLELCLSPAKSEVLGFYNRRSRGPPPSGLSVGISGEKVMVGLQMKYLGLIIDSQWSFEPHFKQLRLMPYAECCQTEVVRGCLYEGVVRLRVLYGTPIWAKDLSASRRSLAQVRGLHRMTAMPIIRGYRTVSYAVRRTPLSSCKPSHSKEDTRIERSCHKKDSWRHPSPLTRR
jgi:hypothetical protein